MNFEQANALISDLIRLGMDEDEAHQFIIKAGDEVLKATERGDELLSSLSARHRVALRLSERFRIGDKVASKGLDLVLAVLIESTRDRRK